MVRSQAVQGWTIAQFARAAEVGVETVRYYQRRGLMTTPDPPGNGIHGGGVRRYGVDDLRHLRFIRSAQGAGFTLDQIGELLALDATDDRARARELATRQIAALDARIAELEQARASLRRLAQECGSSAAGPCPILTAFDTAGGTAQASGAGKVQEQVETPRAPSADRACRPRRRHGR